MDENKKIILEQTREKWDVPHYEPDLAIFEKEDCYFVIRRHPAMLFLCGYIALLPSHPLYNDDYIDYEVHWGVTFHKTHDNETNDLNIFDWGVTFLKDVRILGFDCGHFKDWALSGIEIIDSCKEGVNSFTSGIYRDMRFVIDQLDSLYEQMKKRAKEIRC